MRLSDLEMKEQESKAVPSTKSEDAYREKNIPESVAVSGSVAATESSAISTSLSSWEEVKPMSESFLEVKLPSEQQSAAGDMVTSQMGQDTLGSFMELSLGKESFKDSSGAGDSHSHAVSESKEQAETGGGEVQVEDDQNVTSGNVQKESIVTDDIQSLQSDDTSNGETHSFENINSGDEATSLAGPQGGESGENHLKINFHVPSTQQEQMAVSAQSTEQLGVEGLGEKTAGTNDSLPSFEQISETDSSASLNPNERSIVVIEKPAEENSQSRETMRAQEVPQTEEKTQSEVEKSKGRMKSKTTRPLSAGDCSENLPSFEVEKKTSGGSREEFYSSESLHSLATSTSSGSKQDFYSPISSPATVDSSTDNVSFLSCDESEASEDLTFYDLEASGRVTPPTPQDRTPTNTPVSHEFEGQDAESVEILGEEMSSSRMEESVVMDKTPKPNQAGEDEGLKGRANLATESQQQADDEQVVPETSPAAGGGGKEKTVRRSLLNIDKDKMTEAILRAQAHPDHLEIGHLQILVELLKQDDWTLLNTTLECIISATAFTINVVSTCSAWSSSISRDIYGCH